MREAERTLVERMLAGDEAAFDLFAADYVPAVYRFAQRRLGDRELTRDIVQTTLCRAIAKLATFRGESELMTWLCACCRNEIAAHFRRLGRREPEMPLTGEVLETAVPLAPAPPGPEQALLHKERAALVHAVLDGLPPHYGMALEWKYLDRQPVERIAARFGVGVKAAESLLTRARQAFREGYARAAAGGDAPDRELPVARERTAP
ncbi:MAG TPA: sigma-70 family RNA polymerase sigma factor [Thermoanaerobaculia bacterium]|nr:sigma-70 family RNA polymerase sigma factor [Thermoanaerobaculia bacterium]